MTDRIRPRRRSEPERLTCSIAEAAKLLGVGTSAAYQAAREGRLPAIRWGSRWRVSVAALEKMLEVVTERAIEKEREAQEQGRAPLIGGRPWSR